MSFTHSAVYVSLLVCAFVLGSPQPETFILGMAHGLMWIGMSLVCLAAARARIIPFWLAVTWWCWAASGRSPGRSGS